MAVLKGTKISSKPIGAKLSYITLSGTVKLSGYGIARKIHIYKKGYPDSPNIITSASDGTWSIDLVGGTNDTFRLICIGEDGENSQIFDHIVK